MATAPFASAQFLQPIQVNSLKDLSSMLPTSVTIAIFSAKGASVASASAAGASVAAVSGVAVTSAAGVAAGAQATTDRIIPRIKRIVTNFQFVHRKYLPNVYGRMEIHFSNGKTLRKKKAELLEILKSI